MKGSCELNQSFGLLCTSNRITAQEQMKQQSAARETERKRDKICKNKIICIANIKDQSRISICWQGKQPRGWRSQKFVAGQLTCGCW